MQSRQVDAVELYLGWCRLWCAHNLRERCGQCHLIAEVYVSTLQEFGHLRTCSMQTGQHGEDRLLALANLLIQHIVSLVELGETRSAADYGDGIDITKLVFAIVDDSAQLFGSTCGKKIDRVGY